MTSILGTGIFWTTLTAIVAVLTLSTLIGRGWASMLPFRFSAQARFYLAPSFGLATLTVIASLMGRIFALGDSIIIPLIVISLFVWSIVREQNQNQAFRHCVLVSVFGIVCGASVLGPLFVYGAFNAHNDAFTYLVHANWLQVHAFSQIITADTVTPLTTQVSLYQQGGFRMGASFLLALLQSVLNLHWSYEVYPAVVIASISICCLAIGFPLARVLYPMRRTLRLVLLALPAFSLGGLVFGANLGFLPQTVGLATGASLLFMVGRLLKWITTPNVSQVEIWKAAFPSAIIFVAATFAYSELTPFLMIAVFISAFIIAFRYRNWRTVLVFCGVLFGLSVLLLNTELIRIYGALHIQSGAVVGSPVDWSLLGYIAHAYGVHGGAWDGFQWSNPNSGGTAIYVFGLLLLGIAFVFILASIKSISGATVNGTLLPTVVITFVFLIGILYFRYFVASPFSKGIGQSWSQFKLSDWANPFQMTLVLFGVAFLRTRLRKHFDISMVVLFMIGLFSTTIIGVARTKPLMNYYSGIHDLNKFYTDFRNTVIASCPTSAPIYLSLGGQHHKFRQMAMLYLYDREVTSDWTDDGYIFTKLPAERRSQELMKDDCVVEPLEKNEWLKKGTVVGPYKVGVFDGHGQIRITSVIGAYDRESDGSNWWHWIQHKVSFKLQSHLISTDINHTKLYFEYGVRGNQTLRIQIYTRDGSFRQFTLHNQGEMFATFEKIIDLPPSEVTEISIETDGHASRLGEQDSRMAAWIIRNVNITSESP